MPYIHFTQEQKDLAARTDLEVFLRSRGEKLLPSGQDKRLVSDHSVTITAPSHKAADPSKSVE